MATTTYVGFYGPTEGSPLMAAVRETGGPPPEMAKKVNEFQKNLPKTCKLVGSWVLSGRDVSSVIVVEAESYDDLQHINNYYQGWVAFTWHPAVAMRRDW